MSTKRKIVIVGGVALGASAAARLRRLSEQDEIILLEKDEYISFANCGLPYYIGDVIKERSKLIVQTKEAMHERFNIDVRNYTEAIKINRDVQNVVVKDLKKNEEYTIDYDILILAPGANPVMPNIKGIEQADNVFKLRNIPDTDKIKEILHTQNIKEVSIVGAGFIGLEMAENLTGLGIKVTVLDFSQQVMNMFDDEIAKLIQNNLEHHGIKFKLGTSIEEFKDNGKELVLTDRSSMKTDLTLMAIGVAPDIKLAQKAGLEIGELNGILVNEYNQTSDPKIYAGGDAIEVKNYLTKKQVKIPLAWPANRQGRLIADHINGIETPYNGSMGSAVIKINEHTAAATGLSEKQALSNGYDVQAIHINRGNHAGYYPGATNIVLKLIYDVNTRKVLGAQAFGQEGTDKRIDVVATAIKLGASVDNLPDLELCYAPPFSSAKDPVNIAGYVASNVLAGAYIPFYVQDVDSISETHTIIDVRTPEEYACGHIKNSINMPLDDFRDNLDKIDFNKDIYITCQVGHRGYLATRILKNEGFKANIYNLSGGYALYSAYTKK